MGKTYPTYCSLRSGGVLLTYPLFSRGRQLLPTVMIRRDSFNIGGETLFPSIVYLQVGFWLCSFKRSPVLEDKNVVLQKYWWQKLKRFKKWKGRCSSSNQYIMSGQWSHTLLLSFFLSSLGLSYVNSLGASSFWETGKSSPFPCIHCYSQFRTKYSLVFLSVLIILVWPTVLNPQKQYFKNKRQKDCIIF